MIDKLIERNNKAFQETKERVEQDIVKIENDKYSSSYDRSKKDGYVPRKDRKEWDMVGMMGKLRMLKGQPTGDRWIKMRDISDTVEEWLVR